MSGAEQQLQPACASLAVRTGIREALADKKARLERQLAEINSAIEALDANPEVARVMELVAKASQF